MIPLLPAAVDPDALPDLSWLSPAIGGAALVIVAAVNGVAALVRRRQDRQDALVDKSIEKQPTEKDEWSEVRAAREEASRYYNLMRWFESAYYTMHTALQHLARMIHDKHPDIELGKEVTDALALRPPEDPGAKV
jgi:hypothetical protein